MATSIAELAASARKKKHDGISWQVAVYQAIRAKGITAEADVRRLFRQTMLELSRHGAAARNANRNRGWKYPRFARRQG